MYLSAGWLITLQTTYNLLASNATWKMVTYCYPITGLATFNILNSLSFLCHKPALSEIYALSTFFSALIFFINSIMKTAIWNEPLRCYSHYSKINRKFSIDTLSQWWIISHSEEFQWLLELFFYIDISKSNAD